ncbi:dimethylaniline monooxygenase [N-oxide-forming] 2-like [Glandiceps talaboti]
MACDTATRTRVAVIGAGVAGLTSIKSCLEDGHEPVCYERHDKLGGIWNYDDKLRPGQGAALYRSVVTNNSKEVSTFSDFPFPKEYTPYITHDKALAYLNNYAKHFDLEKYITFNANVKSVERNDGDGRYWKVVVQVDDDTTDEYFDYVMVCSGMYSKRFIPDYPGLDTFQGVKIHANEYRDATEFRNKRVVVVGGCHTAGEVSCEIARNDSEVYLSMRHGTWCLPRISSNGLPFDLNIFTRANIGKSPSNFATFLEKFCKERIPDYKQLGLQCTKSSLATKSLMIIDDIQDRVVQGQLVPVGEIESFDQNDVKFKDGTLLKNIDAVIFGTGYHYSVPIVDQSLLYDDEENLKLYKYVFPLALEQPQRLAVIGVVHIAGPVWPVCEMQARWASKLFSGSIKLPDKRQMMKDIEKYPMYVGANYEFVPGFGYLEDLAEAIGVKPSFWKLMLSDPKLAYAFEYGPMVPYWYRLQGPNTWSGAKDAILNVWENTKYPTRRYRSNKTT